MSRNPLHILKKLGAVLGAGALAICASLAVSTPALAESTTTYGNLTFRSDSALSGVMSDAEGEVVVSGTADIQVTPAATPDGVDITHIVIGGEGDDAYSGSISFQGVTLDPVEIDINSANVGFASCTLTGGSDAPTIVVAGPSAIFFTGTNALTGGAGASGANSTDGTAALRATSEAAMSVSGTMTVNGGAGGNLDATQGQPTAGGPGIYAPASELSMESGSLTVKAGNTYTATADATPRVLPVGLTVGELKLSNGTGIAGEGPEITAVGWPSGTSTPLPIAGLDAGSSSDGTFYPWVLQASQSLDGSDPFLMDFAGSGNTDPIQRVGWRWFNISPHEVTGLEIVAISNADEPGTTLGSLTNPMPGDEDQLDYTLGVNPVFADLSDMEIYGWIDGAVVSEPVATPADAVSWLGMGDSFTVARDYTGDSIAFSGTATLPEAFTALYPNIPTSVDTTCTVEDLTMIYRLYNRYNGNHLYTTDVDEVQGAEAAGWTFEHGAWMQPGVATAGDATIVRLYNPYTGDHYYVPETDTAQIDELEGYGWKRESEAANLISVPEADGFPIYTLFNPYVKTGTHLYTQSADEESFLEGLGWQKNTTIIYSLPITLTASEA